MGEITYQRPREKLRDRGVAALSTVELLQVVIGSGNKKSSAARIAKSIASLLVHSNELSYYDAIRLPGLGAAKAAQVIAAIELGQRLGSVRAVSSTSKPVTFTKIATSSKRTLEYVTINGRGEYITHQADSIADITKATLAVRKMFANSLHDFATSLIIGIGSKTHPTDILDAECLKLIKMIFDTADLLEVKVDAVWLVSKTTQQEFRRKALQ